MIAQAAIDLIIAEEVTSKAYYIKHYTRPEWPGGSSGVTVGIGYDLGYATTQKVASDWKTLVSPVVLMVMQSCCGKTGAAAKGLLPSVKERIEISWEAAYSVFINRDIPQWTAACLKALGPNFSLMSSTCQGVLVSIAYNRGAGGFNSGTDRNREMLAIRNAVRAKDFSSIPGLIDSMARLWVGTSVSGVATRRHREATLFRKGLSLPLPAASAADPRPIPEPDPAVVNPVKDDLPARTKPPATSTAQNTTTGAIVVAGGTAAQQAASHGFSGLTLVLIGAVAVALAAAVWTIWYRSRNPQ